MIFSAAQPKQGTAPAKGFLFLLLFGCPTANFGTLFRGKPHPSNLNHWVLSIFNLEVTGSLKARLNFLVGFEPGTFWINQCLSQTGQLCSLHGCSFNILSSPALTFPLLRIGFFELLWPPTSNLLHISHNDQTWHSYTLTKKNQKHV